MEDDQDGHPQVRGPPSADEEEVFIAGDEACARSSTNARSKQAQRDPAPGMHAASTEVQPFQLRGLVAVPQKAAAVLLLEAPYSAPRQEDVAS